MEQIILILKQHLVVTEMVAEAKILVQKHSTNILFNFHLLNIGITMSSLWELRSAPSFVINIIIVIIIILAKSWK